MVRDGLTSENFNKSEDKYYHFILLAKDAIGHQQIREISTRAWLRSYMTGKMRRVPTYYQDIIEIIGKNPGHVIGSTACLGGFIPTKLLQWESNLDNNFYQKIISWVKTMDNLFGHENFYLELQPSASKEQTFVNRELINLSNITQVPYIITTDSHYLKKEDASIHKAYLNSQDGDREVDSFYATTYMMNTEELESHLLLSEEELNVAYQNIINIKNQCKDYSLLKPLRIPELLWKTYPDNKNLIIEYTKNIPYIKTFYDSSYFGDKVLANAIVDKLFKRKDLNYQEMFDAINVCLEMTWISS